MFCKFCGNQIDSDSLFCPHCGKRLSNECQTRSRVKVFADSIMAVAKSAPHKVEESSVIEIPTRHRLCPYCEKVKPAIEFNLSDDEEFIPCKSCKEKHDLGWRLSLGIPALLWVIGIVIGIIVISSDSRSGIESYIGLVVGAFFALVPAGIIFFILDYIFSFTPLGDNISKQKKNRLKKLKDAKGELIFQPIIRSTYEELYKLKTGHYPSRDILPGHFRCPCCNKQIPLTLAKSVEGEDNDTKIIGRRMVTKTTSYNYNVCSDCYSLKSKEAYITLGCLILGLICGPIVLIHLNGFGWGWFIGGFLAGIFGAPMLAYIIVIPFYRLLVRLFTGRNLFVYSSTAASNNALNPLK